MPSIRIRNIGAIADTGVIDLTPVMLIVGRQSSGKSTFLKVLCFCSWIEKQIVTKGSEAHKYYSRYHKFFKELKSFYRFDDGFFCEESSIFYEGKLATIVLDSPEVNVKIKRRPPYKPKVQNSKICFIPSERNLASVIPNIDRAYRSSNLDVIFSYLLEYQEARTSYNSKEPLTMPFDKGISYFFDEQKGEDKIYLEEQKRAMPVSFASSGIQSAMPLSMLVDYALKLVGSVPKSSVNDITSMVAKIVLNDGEPLTADSVKVLKDEYKYKSVQLYLEEPEENLFPRSQYDLICFILKKLQEASSVEECEPSRIVMTTHSPYILTTLNFLMKATEANDKQEGGLSSDDVPILPSEWFSAFRMTEAGSMEDIVDHEDNFIKGDYLDSLSDFLSDESAKLDDIIYGTTD